MPIKDPNILHQCMNNCNTCFVAMSTKTGVPYVIPMNFCFDGAQLILHSGPEGKKINIIRENPQVCVSFSENGALRHGNKEVACTYSMRADSVILQGEVSFVDELEEKKQLMNLLMKKYTGKDDFNYDLPALKNVCVWRVKPTDLSGRMIGLRYKEAIEEEIKEEKRIGDKNGCPFQHK